MKRIFFAILLILLVNTLPAQTFQMTVKPGTGLNTVRAVIKPSTSTSEPKQISSAQITVLVPTSIPGPRPTAAIRNNPITGMGYVQYTSLETLSDGTFYVYQFDGVGGSTVPDVNYVANTEYQLLEIEFLDRPDVTSQVRLAQLPNGGTAGQAPGQYNFYLALEGSDAVNQTAPFYGTVASNDGLGYSGYSFTTINNVVLPVSWLNFNAVRNINDVRVTWDVANEINVDRYEIEVSTNGIDFVKFATVPKSTNNSLSYSQLDVQVARYSAKQLHYRIKQFDRDGKFSYSPTKIVRLDMKGEIAVYPNPAKEGFTLTIPYLNANQQKVQLQLVNGLGQVVERRDITRVAATNYYFSLNTSLVTSGEYMLRIYEDGELMETKKVSVKR